MIDELNSGERLYAPYEKLTDDVMGGVQEHLDRYNFALKFLTGNEIVVDAACGSGYGSEILARKAKKVIGLEVSEHALEYARKNHQKPNIEFQKTNLNQKISLPDNLADVIVSFETLEHLVNHGLLISEFKRILKPHGLLVISTPDKDLISGGHESDNPFHLKELTKLEFTSLLKKYFILDEFYGQGKVRELPWWKRMIKILGSVTILRKAKQFLVKKISLEKVVHQHFAAEEYTPIEKTTVETPNQFYVMIAVCRK